MNLLFAWRYFKAKKSTNAINIIAWISIAAIVIGTAALVLVLSVFNGFEGLVKSLYSSFYTDIKIIPAEGKMITVTADQLQKIQGLKGIRNFSMVVEEKALVQYEDHQSMVTLKGVDDNYRYVTGVEKNVVIGEFKLGKADDPYMVMGIGVEGALFIQADQPMKTMNIYLPRKGKSAQLDMYRDISNDEIHPSGAFMIQQDFDNRYAFTNIDFVRKALELGPDEYSSVEIAVTDPSNPDPVISRLKDVFGDKARVQNKYEQNRSLYSIMNVERWAIYGVLCLILVVAAFNMIGALTMLVLEKRKDISIIHALGGSRTLIQKIFLSEGILIATIGAGAGMLIAWIIAEIQLHHPFIPLQGGSFLIKYYPVELKLTDFLMVGATVFVIALIASWFPSRKAAAAEFSLRSE
ncbi:MAG: ABC transporter permease [Chitinophagaceae bacterium]|nr:ABC transporter permease [Chitinophagaceae bacterium]